MQKKLPNAHHPISDETVNLVEILNSICLMTNSTVIVYDYTKRTIVYAHLSGAVNYTPKYPDKPNVDLQLYLGEYGMKEIEKICYTKDSFMKRLSNDEKQKMVVYGHLNITNDKSIIKDLCISFLGNTIAFTQDEDLRYELFKITITTSEETELKIFNGVTGGCWRHSALSNRWLKMPILQFSAFEKQVMSLSIVGMSSKQIAAKINRPEISVKKAKSRIMQAVNATNMTEASFILSHLKFL